MKEVKDIVKRLSNQELRIIPVRPIGPSGLCHWNAELKVKQCGGKVIRGWLIDDYGWYVDAVYHSVWQSQDGEIVDVTEKEDGEEAVLYLVSDNQERYDCRLDFCFPKSNNKSAKKTVIQEQRRRWKARVLESRGCDYHAAYQMIV